MNKPGYQTVENSSITGIVIVLLLLVPSFAAVDGMAFHYRPTSSLESLEIGEQRAVIGYKDGIQRMFLTVTLGKPGSGEDASRSAVWIFPVPGSPDRADVDVTDLVPELKRDDVGRVFQRVMSEVFLVPISSQPHYLPFLAFFWGPTGTMMGVPNGMERVTTHETVNGWGVHDELIAANSVERLAEYLGKKNVKVIPEVLSPFVPCLSDKYVLVVAWISSYDDLIKRFPSYAGMRGDRQPSLYVEFPTDKPFYPIRPTSDYGKRPAKISPYLVGLLRPDTTAWTPSEKKAMHPEVDYCTGTKLSLEHRHRAFLSTDEKDAVATRGMKTQGARRAVEGFLAAVPDGEVPFTRVVIRALAENFTQDLRFSPNPRAYITQTIATSQWVIASLGIIVLVIFSYVSGGISGKLLFGEWQRWARIGLWNCLTIAALVARTWLARRDLDSGHEDAAASLRRESLVFGALVCAPLLLLVVCLYRLYARPPYRLILQILFFILITVELLVAAWIVSKPGSAKPDGQQPGSESKWGVVAQGVKDSFIRVGLMCASAFVLGIPLLLFCLMSGGPWTLISAPGQVTIGLLILYSLLSAIGLTAMSWIVRRTMGSDRPTDRGDGPGSLISAVACRKPAAFVLGTLTCIVALVVAISDPLAMAQGLSPHGTVLRIACFGSITVLLAMATWIVWRGAPSSTSMEVQVSPWPVALSGFLALLAVSGVLTYLATTLFNGDPENLIPAIVLWGLIALIGVLNRNRIRRFCHAMTYRNALSVLFVMLGVLSYFGALQQFLTAFVTPIGRVTDSIVVFALLSGTWLVKGELQHRPTKALRFGVLFSVVFVTLNIVAWTLLGINPFVVLRIDPFSAQLLCR